MAEKPTYQELEQRIKELEEGSVNLKLVEEALRIERNNLKNIFESIEDGIYIVNQKYDIQYVNPVIVKDFGPYEGVKCYRYFHDRDEVCPWCKNQDVWAGKTVRWEWYSVKNGRSYDLMDTPLQLPDGSIGKLEIFRDITERKQADKEKESLARFPSENPNPVLRVAKDGTILYANAAALPLLRAWGCQESQPLPDEWRKFSSDVFSSGLRKDSEVEYEDNVFSLTFAPVVNEEYLNIYGLNITERKRAEEALRESEIKHKTLIKNIPGMVYRAYPDWSAKIVSGCEKISSYTTGELNSKEKNWLSIIHPDDTERVFKEGSVLATRPKDLTQTYRIITKYGNIRWVEDHKTSLVSKEGEFIGIDGIVFDITERKHAEEALRESEEKYRSMMESMKDETYICSSDFRIQYMNPATVSRIGHDATGELCYKTIYGLDEQCSWCVFDKVLQGEYVEYELLNPNNNRYYSISNSPIRHTDSSISKLAVCRDITDVKKMELQLQQAHKMKIIGTLAGGIAHKFNNALYMITGNIDLLEMDFPSDENVANYAKEMKASARQMTHLAAQLLAYARGGKYQAKTVSLSNFVKETLSLVKHTTDIAGLLWILFFFADKTNTL